MNNLSIGLRNRRIAVLCNLAIQCIDVSALLALIAAPCAALTVTQPTASTVIPAGDDYATQILGNAWDMNDVADIDTDESGNVTNQNFAGGLFSADTTTGDNNVFPLFMGYFSSINSSRGYAHPIDTSHYRYFTFKLRATRPSANTEVAYLLFLQGDSGSYNNGTFGETNFIALPASQWLITTLDLVTNNDSLHHQWLDFPQVLGLRLNPAVDGTSPFQSVHFEIDWIRLTAPATNAQKTTVQWTDSGYSGTYSISIVDAGGVSFTLNGSSNVSGTSYQADLTFLPPGQYTITVARNSGSPSPSSVTFRINSPPQVAITAPDAHGDPTQNFALSTLGNPWGPPPAVDATDFSLINNFTNISYTMPPTGSFYGRPTSADPQWYLNLGGHTIDASLYRSLCFTLKDFGMRSIGLGSVARFFWGPPTGLLAISQDVPLHSGGPNEYCFADLGTVPIEPSSQSGPWSGTQSIFRLDPHEFPVSSACTTTPSPANCHDVELDSVVLSPFAQANPGYTFKWNLTDNDDSSLNLNLYLDPDTTLGNVNELLIYSAAVPNSNGQYMWPGSGSVNYGTYHVLAVADDGKNSVNQYSTGVIIVGARDGIFRNGFDVLP